MTLFIFICKKLFICILIFFTQSLIVQASASSSCAQHVRFSDSYSTSISLSDSHSSAPDHLQTPRTPRKIFELDRYINKSGEVPFFDEEFDEKEQKTLTQLRQSLSTISESRKNGFFEKIRKKLSRRGSEESIYNIAIDKNAAAALLKITETKEIKHGSMSRIFYSRKYFPSHIIRAANITISPKEIENDEIIKSIAQTNRGFSNYFAVPIAIDINKKSSDIYYSLIEFLDGGSLFDKVEELYKEFEEENKRAIASITTLTAHLPILFERVEDLAHISAVYKLSRHLLTGLRLLHDHGHAHRDIKPANIMLTSEEKGKIIDFGEMGLRHLAGSFYFQMPEFIEESSPVTELSECSLEQAQEHDIYSVGVSLYAYLHKGIYPLIFYRKIEDIYNKDDIIVQRNFKQHVTLATDQMTLARENKISAYKETKTAITFLSEEKLSLTPKEWVFFFDRTIESFFHPTNHITAEKALKRLDRLKKIAPEELKLYL